MTQRRPALIAAIGFLLTSLGARVGLANACVWNGSASSDWGSLFNWSSCGSTIPQPGDTVTIPNVANQPTMFNPSSASLSMLTIASGATLTVQSPAGLTLTAGMTGAGNLIVTSNGALVWTGGTMDGTGTTTVAGHLTLSGSAKTLARDFTSSSSTGVLSGAGSLTISPGTTFHNNGTLDIQGDGGITGGGVLENTFLLMRTTSSSGTTISCNLASSGAVTVSGTGGLSLSGNGIGTYTGVFNATGSYLGILGGTHTFGNSVTADHLSIQASTVIFDAPTSALSSFFVSGGGPPVQVQSFFSSPGTTNLMGGSLTATPSASVPSLGNLSVQGGTTLTLNGSAPVAVTSLFQQGDLVGSENIVIAGNFTWSGGMHSGPGTTTVNGTTSLSGGTLALSRGLTLNGPSTFGSTSLALSPGLVIHNAGNLSIPPFFTDLTGTNVSLENSGSVTTNGGTTPLSLACSVSNTGTFSASNRDVTAGSFTQTAGTSTVFFGSLAVTAPPIRFQGGTVTGHGTIKSDAVLSGSASVAPGLSPGSFGTLVFGGSYTQSAPAAYTADAGSSGTMFTDLVSVPFAAAVIGGPLNLTVGFTPAAGDTVPLLSYGSRFGSFSPLGLPPLASGLAWAPRYSATGFSLRVQSLVQDTPVLVDAHPASAGVHNGNGVLDPGERVLVEPRWDNFSNGAIGVTGLFSNLTGPSGATYTIAKASADYGTISANQTADCFSATGSCYEISIDNPATRPAAHWDVTVDETASNGDLASWTFHVGGSFNDVSQTAGQYRFIETLFHNLITGGCGGGGYCPASSVTRAQMAVFLLKARFGPSYVPPPATGLVFADVPVNAFAPFIETLAGLGVTTGCGGGNYCPGSPATRAQMAVFLLKTQGGPSYTPPPCVTPTFSDVPCSNGFAAWIEELVHRGITAGCGNGMFCPATAVTRGQMAVFLTVTFGLGLNGP